MANISREDILKLAGLSKLELSDKELSKFASEINDIVGYIEMLQGADVAGLQATNQVTGLVNSTREDVIRNYQSQDELLKNLPDSEGRYIKTKRVIE